MLEASNLHDIPIAMGFVGNEGCSKFKLTAAGRKVDLSGVIFPICDLWKVDMAMRSQFIMAVGCGNGGRIGGNATLGEIPK
jgi:hypothetical protein